MDRKEGELKERYKDLDQIGPQTSKMLYLEYSVY